MSLGHVMLFVKDIEVQAAWYEATLAPLGYTVYRKFPTQVGFANRQGIPDFWIKLDEPKATYAHFAFVAKSIDEIKSVHTVGLGKGGKNHGIPGLRQSYLEIELPVYAAFLKDPEGNNVEFDYVVTGEERKVLEPLSNV